MSRGDQLTVRLEEDLADVVDLYTAEDLVELGDRDAAATPAAGWSVLQQLLDMDGITDLAAYRMLCGHGADLTDVPAPDPPPPPAAVQLPLFFLTAGGGDE